MGLERCLWIGCGLLVVGGLALAAAAEGAAATRGTTITFKVVKPPAGPATSGATVELASGAERWELRRGPTWSGENAREIFFTVQSKEAGAELPRVVVRAPGVAAQRVIVGKTDVSFEQRGDEVRFALVRDERNAMLLNQLLTDPEGGLPIHIYHNWLIRQDGPFRGKPAPEVEVRAVLNYLVAAREALKVMGGYGPQDRKAFEGEITLMSFEVACARGHNDYPPHVHVMLWVPGYVGGEIPHFYMDAAGGLVRNSFSILGDEQGKFPDRAAVIAKKRERAGEYGPGKPCPLVDLQGKVALELTITAEGGLLLRGGSGAACLLIGEAGRPGEAVVVRREGATLRRARVTDDAERGETEVRVEHLEGERVTRVQRQTLRYDPFTGLAPVGGGR